MIRLYGMSSPNVRKPGIMLEELGLDYTLHHVAVMRAEQFTPAFHALNPLNKVPVLVDPDRGQGKPIIESGAILFYLAETYGAFLPASGMERYEVMEWLIVQMANIGPMFGQFNHFRVLGDQVDPYAFARYRTQSERLYQRLNERLETRAWLAGGAYSIADMATFPWAHYLERHGFDPAAYPALLRWRDVIDARPAVRRHYERFSAAFDAPSREASLEATAERLDQFFWRDPSSPAADYSGVFKA